MKENKKGNNNFHERIIYIAILRKKHKILTEYTDCSGNFSQVIEVIMNKVFEVIDEKKEPEIYKARFSYGYYNFYTMKSNLLYTLLMTRIPRKEDSKEEDSIYYGFLYNIYEDIIKKIKVQNIKKLRPYSLSSQYSSELKNKMNSFNNNSIKYNEKEKEIEQYEKLHGKKFEESTQIPILSNDQVHNNKNFAINDNENENNNEDEKNLIFIDRTRSGGPEGGQGGTGFDTSINSEVTLDSFNDDILRSSLKNNVVKQTNDNSIPIFDEEARENEAPFEKRKEDSNKGKCSKCCINTAIIIFTVLMLGLLVFCYFLFSGKIKK